MSVHSAHSISAGGVVLNEQGEVLVVSQGGSSWSLPKGHIEAGEDELTAARREITEESGITDLTLIKRLGQYDRFRIGANGTGDDKTHTKTIVLFLFTTKQHILKPIDPHNPEARWLKKDEVSALLTHQADKDFFESIKSQI